MKRQLLSTVLAVPAGSVFILSGFVKAVDPVGFSYKITEYLSLFGMHGLCDLSMCLSVSLCTAETFLGLLLFLRIWKRTTAVCFLVAMLAFTALTLRLVTDPFGTITECGCFGEAVHLSNGMSFAKNLMLLAVAAAFVHCVFKEGRRARFKWRQLLLTSGAFALSLAVPLLSCLFLPPFYFLDYNVGDGITEDNRIELFDRNLEHVRIDITGTCRPLYIIGLRREMADKEAVKITDLYKAYLAGKVDIVAVSSSDCISSGRRDDTQVNPEIRDWCCGHIRWQNYREVEPGAHFLPFQRPLRERDCRAVAVQVWGSRSCAGLFRLPVHWKIQHEQINMTLNPAQYENIPAFIGNSIVNCLHVML